MTRDHTSTTAPNAAGNKTIETSIPAPSSSRPTPGDVTPSSPGASIASSQTKWETGPSNTQTPSSPDAANGPMNNAATATQTSQARATPMQDAAPQLNATAWRAPFTAWIAITVGALAANLATGNLLWAWYACAGLIISSTLIVLAIRLDWHVPSRLLWWTALPLGLHYVGGSLSGLHQFGGPNGLYYVLPWWDNVVHFLGAAALAVIAAHLLRPHVARGILVLAAVCVSVAIGALVEFYEFLHFIWLGTIDQGYYTNTMLDLYYNALGAWFAAWGYTRR